MKKELKKAYKKLAKYEKKLQDMQEMVKRIRTTSEMHIVEAKESKTALNDLKSALKQKDVTGWYEKRINDLEEMIINGISTRTNYGMMAAQNIEFSKEVRELRLRVYGKIKIAK